MSFATSRETLTKNELFHTKFALIARDSTCSTCSHLSPISGKMVHQTFDDQKAYPGFKVVIVEYVAQIIKV